VSDIAAALNTVRTKIAKAASQAGRPRDGVTLIAVGKTHGADDMQAAIDAGQRDFGENRVQEAAAKWPALKAAHADLKIHLIGPLQSNKTKEAVALFDVIHSLDRPKLAEALAVEMTKQNRFLPCFIQVNTGREEQKAGIDPKDADAFIAASRALKLNVVGLMCIPPVGENPAIHFAFLREIANRNGLPQLSMGMSDDYETAVTFGATHVRVGSAIFGART